MGSIPPDSKGDAGGDFRYFNPVTNVCAYSLARNVFLAGMCIGRKKTLRGEGRGDQRDSKSPGRGSIPRRPAKKGDI